MARPARKAVKTTESTRPQFTRRAYAAEHAAGKGKPETEDTARSASPENHAVELNVVVQKVMVEN